jgi:hypothetical protein
MAVGTRTVAMVALTPVGGTFLLLGLGSELGVFMAQLPVDEIEEDNDLAERILHLVERLQPHRGAILAGLAAVIVAGAAWSLVSAQSAATRAESWDAYLAAVATGNPAGFQDVITRYPDSTASDWSRLVLAEMALREGADLAFSDRARSKGRLEAAVQLYGMVIARKPKGLVAERAVFGLAKAREGLGMLDEARRGYDAIAREHPFGGLAELAATHAGTLGNESTRRWYDWFESQDVSAKKAPAEGGGEAAKPAEATVPAQATEPAEATVPAPATEPAAK